MALNRRLVVFFALCGGSCVGRPSLPSELGSSADSTGVVSSTGMVSPTGMVSSTGGDGASTSTSTSGASGEPAIEEELGRADFRNCDQPLWCYSGSIDNPAGGSTWMQECFRAEMEPPFELAELEVVIRGMSDQLSDVRVEVYERSSGGGPIDSQALASRMVPREDLEIGLNTIPIEPPIELDRQRFCIGLAAPENGLFGALGVAVDADSRVDGVSYFRIQGDGACWFPDWTDIIEDDPTPSGNVCIHGTIRRP